MQSRITIGGSPTSSKRATCFRLSRRLVGGAITTQLLGAKTTDPVDNNMYIPIKSVFVVINLGHTTTRPQP